MVVRMKEHFIASERPSHDNAVTEVGGLCTPSYGLFQRCAIKRGQIGWVEVMHESATFPPVPGGSTFALCHVGQTRGK